MDIQFAAELALPIVHGNFIQEQDLHGVGYGLRSPPYIFALLCSGCVFVAPLIEELALSGDTFDASDVIEAHGQPTALVVHQGILHLGFANGSIASLRLPHEARGHKVEHLCTRRESRFRSVQHYVRKRQHSPEVVALCVSPESKDCRPLLISSHLNGTLRLWDISSARREGNLYNGVLPPEVIPDGYKAHASHLGAASFFALERCRNAIPFYAAIHKADDTVSVQAFHFEFTAAGSTIQLRHRATLLDCVAFVYSIAPSPSTDGVLLLGQQKHGCPFVVRKDLLSGKAEEANLKQSEVAVLGGWKEHAQRNLHRPAGRFIATSLNTSLQKVALGSEALAELAGRGLLLYPVLHSALTDFINDFEGMKLFNESEAEYERAKLDDANDISQLYKFGKRILCLVEQYLFTPWETLATFFDRYYEYYQKLLQPLSLASFDEFEPVLKCDECIVLGTSSSISYLGHTSACQPSLLSIADMATRANKALVAGGKLQEEFSEPELFLIKRRLWHGDSLRDILSDAEQSIYGFKTEPLNAGAMDSDDEYADDVNEGNKRSRYLLLHMKRAASEMEQTESIFPLPLEKLEFELQDKVHEQLHQEQKMDWHIAIFNTVAAGFALRSEFGRMWTVALVAYFIHEDAVAEDLPHAARETFERACAYVERLAIAEASVCSQIVDDESPGSHHRYEKKRIVSLHDTDVKDASNGNSIALPSGWKLHCASKGPLYLCLEALSFDCFDMKLQRLSLVHFAAKLWEVGALQALNRILELLLANPTVGCEVRPDGPPLWASAAFVYGLLAMEGVHATRSEPDILSRLLATSCCASSMGYWMPKLDKSADSAKIINGQYEELLAMRARAHRMSEWSRQFAEAALSRMEPSDQHERLRWRLFNLACEREEATSEALAHLMQLGSGPSVCEGMRRVATKLMEEGQWHQLSKIEACGMNRHLDRSLKSKAYEAEIETDAQYIYEAVHAIFTAKGQHRDAAEMMLSLGDRLSDVAIDGQYASWSLHIGIASACMLSANSLRMVSESAGWLVLSDEVFWPEDLERECNASCARAILCAESGASWTPSQLGAPLRKRKDQQSNVEEESTGMRLKFGGSDNDVAMDDPAAEQAFNQLLQATKVPKEIPFSELAQRLAEFRHFGPAMRCAQHELDESSRSSAVRNVCKSLAAVAGALLIATAVGQYDDADALTAPCVRLRGPLGPCPLGEPRQPKSASDAFGKLRELIDEDNGRTNGLAEAAAESLLAHGGGRLAIPDWLMERMNAPRADVARLLLEQHMPERAALTIVDDLADEEVYASTRCSSVAEYACSWFPYHLAVVAASSLPADSDIGKTLREILRKRCARALEDAGTIHNDDCMMRE